MNSRCPQAGAPMSAQSAVHILCLNLLFSSNRWQQTSLSVHLRSSSISTAIHIYLLIHSRLIRWFTSASPQLENSTADRSAIVCGQKCKKNMLTAYVLWTSIRRKQNRNSPTQSPFASISSITKEPTAISLYITQYMHPIFWSVSVRKSAPEQKRPTIKQINMTRERRSERGKKERWKKKMMMMEKKWLAWPSNENQNRSACTITISKYDYYAAYL